MCYLAVADNIKVAGFREDELRITNTRRDKKESRAIRKLRRMNRMNSQSCA